MSNNAGSFWQQSWTDAQPTLEAVERRLAIITKGLPRVIRVGQLDAELLDQELLAVLKQPISTSLSHIKSTWAAQYDLELSLLIQTLLYKYSVWDTGATYGAKLQDLTFERPPKNAGRSYAPSGLLRKTLLLHATLTILVPYVHAKLRAHALSYSWPDVPRSDIRRQTWDLVTRLETFQATFSLFGFLLFLHNGKYRSLTDRFLGLKLVPARKNLSRNVNYEFMNRQMVWHAFTEFLLFILPLVNTRLLRRRAMQYLIATKTYVSLKTRGVASASAYSNPQVGSSKLAGKYASLPEDCCAICAEDASSPTASASPTLQTGGSVPSLSLSSDGVPTYPITIPYRTSCGHEYCYSCLTVRMLRAHEDGDPGWECLRCKETVKSGFRGEIEIETDGEVGSGLTSGRESFESHIDGSVVVVGPSEKRP
ncbi:peroxisome assembly protein (Peroxin-2) [Tulasnella sp. 424]|nr:peroxisome assembly protein (Peroxin-2) [Tulasnella sp. 424]KAG8972322.1 peroxisome assembly protein (Peroxin-2) [Tulasnella sp. 425]